MQKKMQTLGHGGPIVRQSFTGGAFCEEVGYNRHMDVELRCCTEEEIDHWLESKKQRSRGGNNNNRKKDQHKMNGDGKTPLAVLVGVQEDQTCIYRSRVCTPLLCPKPVAPTTSRDGSSRQEQIIGENKDDPLGALLTAIFGDEMIDHAGQVQVFFPDDDIGHAFDELIRQAEDGVDFVDDPSFLKVREALRQAHAGGSKKLLNLKDFIGGDVDEEDGGAGGAGLKPSSSVMEVKYGESIREILDKTLGKRPCLLKNLGWW